MEKVIIENVFNFSDVIKKNRTILYINSWLSDLCSKSINGTVSGVNNKIDTVFTLFLSRTILYFVLY